MSKPHKLNPLDQAIQARMAVYNTIEGYPSILADQELRYALLFISSQIESLHIASQLILKSFVPAINKSAAEVLGNLSKSIYKDAIKETVTISVQSMKDDTIRLGYVLFFHKYENFVKDYLDYLEQRNTSQTEETGKTFLQYSKAKFGFDPSDWWKYPIIHKVNFISNCTKHHNGKCRLDNPKHTKPKEYALLQQSDILKPDAKQYKEDTTNLINVVANNLVPIVENINMYRALESLVCSFESTIASFKSALTFNEEARQQTFIHNGVSYPLLDGDNLQEYEDKAKMYQAEIVEHTNKMEAYSAKLKACEDKISSNIRMLQTEV